MINCVDLSTWNTGVNYRAVKSDGVVAAILRAGYGREVSQIDSQFETHYKGCRDAGLKIGIYWYSYADSVADAEQEARACLAILNGRAIDMPVYFDMEEAWQTPRGRLFQSQLVRELSQLRRAARALQYLAGAVVGILFTGMRYLAEQRNGRYRRHQRQLRHERHHQLGHPRRRQRTCGS